METRLSGGENDQDCYDLFIAMEGGSRAVRGGGQWQWCRFNVSVSTQEGEATK
jgi:hypothetical protein